MRKVLLIVVALGVGLVFTGAAKAEQAAQPAHKEAKEGKQVKPQLKGLDLTKAQKEQVTAIRKQAKTEADKATTKEEKEKIHKAANDKIIAEVLTDKQRKQLEENQQPAKTEKTVKTVKHEAKHKAATSQPAHNS